MFKLFLKTLSIFFLLFTDAYSEIISEIEITGNNRISKETIITYGNISIGKDYSSNEINEIIKNLYETNFFNNVKAKLENQKLFINLIENKIIQNVYIEGIKSNTFKDSILENLYSKNKSPFSKIKLDNDVKRIINNLNNNGYYFADVSVREVEKQNETIDLFFDINLGDKANIQKIEFIGDKKIKDRTLRNVIITEESKFWKFLSNKQYLNRSLIATDTRLLRNFFLNKGYYDVNISSTTVNYLNNNSFKLTYKIDAGPKYLINSAKLILPKNYNEDNFKNINDILKELNNNYYSFNKISKVVEEIDKISLRREFDFINAEVVEKKTKDNFLDLEFIIKESDELFVERINIKGNNITHENVIRRNLEIDEGDPYNELLQAKSINNLRSLNIFKSVDYKIENGKEFNTRIIDIEIEEKPTGEITLGAGFGTEGGTLGFGVTENNFLGKNINLSTSIRTSEETINASFRMINPDYNYSKKSLITSFEISSTDKLSDNGYKTDKTGFSLGTRYQQFQNTYFSPSFSTYIEDVATSSKASESLRKQSGNYFSNNFLYSIDFDYRNQRFQTTDGSRTVFSQTIPLYSEEYSLKNSFQSNKWFDFGDLTISNIGFFGSMINSLNNEDVRVSDRLSLPRSKLKGFSYGKIGPVDNTDYIGGNYATSINFDTTLPMIFPNAQSIDFKYFIDIGNVWGVDYNDAINDSNKIRSSTGITVDWFTPVGPLNFSIAQDLSKADTDKTESFQFNLGTTF